MLGFEVEINRKQGIPGDKRCHLFTSYPQSMVEEICFTDQETPDRWQALLHICDSSWDLTGFPGGLQEIDLVEGLWVGFICDFSEVLLNLGLCLARISRGRAVSQVLPWVYVLLERETNSCPAFLPCQPEALER